MFLLYLLACVNCTDEWVLMGHFHGCLHSCLPLGVSHPLLFFPHAHHGLL